MKFFFFSIFNVKLSTQNFIFFCGPYSFSICSFPRIFIWILFNFLNLIFASWKSLSRPVLRIYFFLRNSLLWVTVLFIFLGSFISESVCSLILIGSELLPLFIFKDIFSTICHICMKFNLLKAKIMKAFFVTLRLQNNWAGAGKRQLLSFSPAPPIGLSISSNAPSSLYIKYSNNL